MIVWDCGTWQPLGDARAGLQAGRLKFELHGEKLAGRWALVRMKPRANERQPAWLLMKDKDDHARAAADHDIAVALPHSVPSPPTGVTRVHPVVAKADTVPEPAGTASTLPDTLSPQLATLVDAPHPKAATG